MKTVKVLYQLDPDTLNRISVTASFDGSPILDITDLKGPDVTDRLRRLVDERQVHHEKVKELDAKLSLEITKIKSADSSKTRKPINTSKQDDSTQETLFEDSKGEK